MPQIVAGSTGKDKDIATFNLLAKRCGRTASAKDRIQPVGVSAAFLSLLSEHKRN